MREYFNDKFVARKNKILISESEYSVSGRVFYVSSSEGDDKNDGLTTATPWKSLEKVSDFPFVAGDTVLFKRGDLFRGNVRTKSGVTYSAYGTGKKPAFYGCHKSLCDASLWEIYDNENNIWKCTEPMHDAGTIVFDGGADVAYKLIPSYNGKEFVLREDNKTTFNISEQMTKHLDFYWEFSGDVFNTTESKGESFPVPEMYKVNPMGTLYLRCEKGNPGEVFSEIEAVARVHMFIVNDNENVTIDNLCIKYVGMHGVTGGGHVKGLCVKNCEFGYIGGAIQNFRGTDPNFPKGGRGSVTRFGNAVEIYGGCENYTVENNYFYEVYDAAITHQMTTDKKLVMKDIKYRRNVIEKCVYGIEYFLDQVNGENESIMENVEISDNFIRLSGYGWGQQRHNFDTPSHIKSWNFRNTAKNFVISNNIFDTSAYRMLHLVCEEKNSLPRLCGNTYVQTKGGTLGQYGEKNETEPSIEMFDENVARCIKEKFGDRSAKVYFV